MSLKTMHLTLIAHMSVCGPYPGNKLLCAKIKNVTSLCLNLLKQTYAAVYERHKQLKLSTFSKHFIPTSVLQNSRGAACHSEKGTSTWLHCQMKTRLSCCFSALLINPLNYLEYFQVNSSQIYLKMLFFRKADHFADIKRTGVEKPYRLIVWA